MGRATAISWCDHTFNAWWGCRKVPGDPACHNCYAEAWSRRLGLKIWGQEKPRRFLSDNHWREPLKWNRSAERRGVRERVFCSSMADVFEDRRDLDPWRERLWRLIEETPSLDWLLLTKRPQHLGMLDVASRANVWLGTTAVTQDHYDERVPLLLEHDAAQHFVSVEPMMERIDLHLDFQERSRPHLTWVIGGFESGARARRGDDDWLRSLVAQCRERDVACFIKQLGTRRGELEDAKGEDPVEWPPELRVREFPDESRDTVSA